MEPLKIVLLLLGICILSSKAIVNLTWTAEKDMLTLKCKTRPLIWSVQFLSPAGTEIAYCQIPFPSPHCYTIDESYITVNQDTTTNTTILTYKGISSSLNGQWKCIYGNNVDVDVVNVTIQLKDSSMEDIKDENCVEEFYAWTMLGFTMTIVITLLYNTFHFLTGKKSGGCIFGKDIFVYNCLCVSFSNVPTVDVQQPTDSVTTGTDRPLVLKCILTPPDNVENVYWTKDCEKVPTIKSKTNKYSAITTNTPSLTIFNVDKSDEGYYTCFATNRVGIGRSSIIKLSATEKDHPSSVLDCKTVPNNPVDLLYIRKKKVIIAIVLSAIVVVFPMCVGFIATDCKYKEYFIIYGIFKALVMLIFSFNLVTHYVKDYKRNEKNTVTSKDDEDEKPEKQNKSAELPEDTTKSSEDYVKDYERNEKNTVTSKDDKDEKPEKQNKSAELPEDTTKSSEDYVKDYSRNDKDGIIYIDEVSSEPTKEQEYQDDEKQNKSAELPEDTAKSTEDLFITFTNCEPTEKNKVTNVEDNSPVPEESEEPNESTDLLEDKAKSPADSYPDSDHADDAV